MPSQFNNSKGFTLLELLVVISIIGLMASIVLVSLDIAREKAVVAKGLQFGSSIYHAHGDEMVGFWNFNETEENTCSGGEDACDSSGFGNHGAFQNGAAHNNDSPNSALGRSVVFDGVNDYVEIADDDSLDISGPLTIEWWWARQDADLQILWIKGFWNNKNYYGYWNGGSFNLSVNDNGGGAHSISYAFTPVVDRFHHYVFSFDGRYLKFYIDGAEVGTPTDTGGITLKTRPGMNLYLGTHNPGYTRPLSGKVDDFRIYKTALSAAEIQKHYAEGAERHGITLK